jgi:hypothetical protein
MNRPFRQGMIAGLLAPLALVAAALYWVYRATGKLPFPARRTAKGELTIRLIEPTEIPAHWQVWQNEIEPVVERVKSIVGQLLSELRQA